VGHDLTNTDLKPEKERAMKCMNRAEGTSASRPAEVEELEGRRLLAASAVLGADGIVRVEGTPRNDDIVISQHVGKGNRLRVDVTRNGALLGTFLKSQVEGVTAFGGLGDDSIGVGTSSSPSLTVVSRRGDVIVNGQLSGGSLQFTPAATGGGATVNLGQTGQVVILASLATPVTLFGGGGNDTLVGGDGDDRIEGVSGDDVLYGEGGDDVLLGQNDDDSLKGGDDADTLNGGDGDDDLDGDASAPRVLTFTSNGQVSTGSFTVVADGGSGVWTLNGGDGGSVVYNLGTGGSASKHDVLIGGDGADTFHKSDRTAEMSDRSMDEGDRIV
jgi:Ca2+-binding RTX toxin-like protein